MIPRIPAGCATDILLNQVMKWVSFWRCAACDQKFNLMHSSAKLEGATTIWLIVWRYGCEGDASVGQGFPR